MKFFIFTYGCQMNEYDSEIMSGLLNEMNLIQADDPKEADIIIFNTCCVREHAEEKVFGRLGQLKKLKVKNPNLIIAIGGCMTQQKGMADEIIRRFPYIDIVFGTYNTFQLPEMINKVMKDRQSIVNIWEKEGEIIEKLPIKRTDKIKAWIPIIHGCNNFCSYCIVPYVRGRERSRSMKEIIQEAKKLESEGYREITILGQNVNSYGKDLNEKVEFADLLYALNDIRGIKRIRFITSHPKDFSDRLITAISECDNVCEHIHLPLQSGSNKILKLMNRHYTKEHYEELVYKIRNKIPNSSITTDIIIGFPGETDEDFFDTLDLINRLEFDSAFTFMYSKRKGTPAALMPGHIDTEVKKNRLFQLMAVQEEITHNKNRELLGKTLEVLVEGVDTKTRNRLIGRTRTNKITFIDGDQETVGKIVKVKINKTKTWTLEGEIVD
ncbi:MAG TPA: tRNA (N6-isopentenyl adenosine(37)-C2)-methylthiotransferase MiaB [Thermoanaerobacterales bacterium]|nr:tRNA (N6-isopentenyl adenosine(37)-C2)-methylthiotransferase MiaB [Thermoanaerobacterales bacterium]